MRPPPERRRAAPRPAAAVLLVLAAAGCVLPTPQGPAGPVASYVLTPRPPDAAVAPAALAAAAPAGLIGLQTVQLPDYLAQRPIVTRAEANRLSVAADAEWAGDLADNLTDVLVVNLGGMLGRDRVLRLPVSPAVPVETVVGVEVAAFEREPGGAVRLAARWIVLADGGRRFRLIDYATHEATGVAADYPAIAAAMSDLAAALSDDIARSLAAPGGVPAAARAGPAALRGDRPASR